MEKGVKQGKSSYLLLSMKKDQANRTNVERVYRWWPLAWEPGLNGSGVGRIIICIWNLPTQPSSEGWRVPSRFPQIQHSFTL